MSKVTVTVVTVPTTLPAGVTAGALRVSLLDNTGAVVATQDVATSDAVFTGIANGDYTASAVRLDGTGTNLGDAVTAPFSVADVPPPVPEQTFDAPSSLAVVVEAE